MSDTQLLYLIHGKDSAFLEGRFSILSAFAAARRAGHAAPTIAVLTDRPDAFHPLPVTTLPLDRVLLKQWQEPIHFVHRAKICALLSLLPRAEKSVLIDADTLFLQAPQTLFDRISETHTLLHANEGDVYTLNPHFRVRNALLEHVPTRTLPLGGGAVTLAPNEPMWNSGIVGVHHTHARLFPQMLAITDLLHPLAKAHTIEQFAIGITLSRASALGTCEDIVEHYWDNDAYIGWPDWKSRRDMHHDQAQKFFDAHPHATFDQLLTAFLRHPPNLFRVTPTIKTLAFLRRRTAKLPTPLKRAFHHLGL
jgi:hypothetical protein